MKFEPLTHTTYLYCTILNTYKSKTHLLLPRTNFQSPSGQYFPPLKCRTQMELRATSSQVTQREIFTPKSMGCKSVSKLDSKNYLCKPEWNQPEPTFPKGKQQFPVSVSQATLSPTCRGPSPLPTVSTASSCARLYES